MSQLNNNDFVIYTVDDEEPICNKCDHCYEDESYCENQCGANHAWNGYERVERSVEEY